MNLCTLRRVIFSGITWPRCLPLFFFFFLSIRILNKTINEHTNCYLKADDTLLKITI